MFSCFLARAGATALERPRVARGRSLPRRFFLCANGRVKARDWIFVCFNYFLFSIRCRSALEADAEESSRMVDLEFISRESWLEVGLQSGAPVFYPRRQVNKVGVCFPSARVRARVDAYTDIRSNVLFFVNSCKFIFMSFRSRVLGAATEFWSRPFRSGFPDSFRGWGARSHRGRWRLAQ